MVKSMEQLQELVKEGFDDWESLGHVKTQRKGNLILLSYTRAAQYEGRWNWLERTCRGLILNARTGEVVARPFDKFFNWTEGGRTSSGHIVTVTEKIDGSLGIHYRDETLPPISTHTVATRGSFESEQAMWATEHLRSYYDLCDLPDDLTLLFEIVYPENRIVVDYDGREDLFLLAARNRHTGKYLPFFPDVYELAERYEFPTPGVVTFNSVTDIIAATDALDASAEGWVAEFSDGQRFKFKGDRYLELHRLVTGISFKRVLRWVAEGSYQEMISGIPDELLGQVKEWKRLIDEKVHKIEEQVSVAFSAAPKGCRKTFALWVNAEHRDIAPYLFARMDGREIANLIYKKEFKL